MVAELNYLDNSVQCLHRNNNSYLMDLKLNSSYFQSLQVGEGANCILPKNYLYIVRRRQIFRENSHMKHLVFWILKKQL